MPQLATFSSNSYDPDRLIAGPSDELLSRQITLITGQNLVRGALLGKIATAGTDRRGRCGRQHRQRHDRVSSP
jgi:hypothetical protein